MTLADSGAFDDPFVRGINPLGQFGIGHDPARQCRARA